MRKIKYGIIGAGTMAREHILNISLINNAEVVALSDPNEDSLNLSKEIISRHPFPGPGLAIRMPGKITKEKISILKEADHYFIQALRDHKLYHKIWQAYAALLPVKTVGVMGDNRTYEYLCLLRAITSEDGMTADFYEFKKSFIQEISNKIVNSIRGINRVVYDITSKPPSTIELE